MYLFWSSELGMVASKDEQHRCCILNEPTGPGVQLHWQSKREKMTRKLDDVCSSFGTVAATSMKSPSSGEDETRMGSGGVVHACCCCCIFDAVYVAALSREETL
uniref:Uncharacterized protein n=1 Tax=Solanum tuberosum TaxID=4113 RepID=M1DUJ9_SOLTU